MSDPPKECTLMGQGVMSYVVQATLALVGLSSLVVKRCFEHPQRQYNVWILDVTKQAFSGACAHVLGMVNASILDGIEKADPGKTGNQCSWYFIAFSLDTSVGVMFAFCGIKLVESCARQLGLSSLEETGRYGNPPDKVVWAKQMLMWCVITIAARLCVLGVMLAAQDPLGWVSQKVASPFDGHDPMLFLVLVMIGCPLCMNVLQLWVQDTFLKWQEWSAMPLDAGNGKNINRASSA